MKAKYTDEEIISMIQGTSEEREKAVEYLYLEREFRAIAFSQISKYIDDQETADEIYLESLIALRANILLNKFELKSKLSTYFVVICRNKSITYLNQQQKEVKYKNEQAKIMLNKAQYEQNDVFQSEENRYTARIKRRIYRQLTDKCRYILREKLRGRLKMKDMATALGVNEQSVKNRWSKCREKLRNLILADKEASAIIREQYGKF